MQVIDPREERSEKRRGERTLQMQLSSAAADDAPALRQAAIGIAMGERGPDVAREAVDLVLSDDNFAAVTSAMLARRVLYENLWKAVRYYLAAKVALITASLVAAQPRGVAPPQPFLRRERLPRSDSAAPVRGRYTISRHMAMLARDTGDDRVTTRASRSRTCLASSHANPVDACGNGKSDW